MIPPTLPPKHGKGRSPFDGKPYLKALVWFLPAIVTFGFSTIILSHKIDTFKACSVVDEGLRLNGNGRDIDCDRLLDPSSLYCRSHSQRTYETAKEGMPSTGVSNKHCRTFNDCLCGNPNDPRGRDGSAKDFKLSNSRCSDWIAGGT